MPALFITPGARLDARGTSLAHPYCLRHAILAAAATISSISLSRATGGL
jgi:hypothetical protein